MISPIDFHFDGSNRTEAFSALLRFYPNYSVLRRTLKVLNALNQLGPQKRPRNMDHLDRIGRSLPELGAGRSRSFLLHKVNQNGRIYLLDQDVFGQLCSVIKLAVNEETAKGIRREADVLGALAGRTEFKIPRVLALESWDGGCFLRMSAAPHEFLVHNKSRTPPEALFQAIAALRPETTPKAVPARNFESWQSARKRIRTAEICEIASEIRADDEFDAAAAHGDLGSENVFSRLPAQAVCDFTIIDWECFCETAPALTDRVGFWLGRHHLALKGWFRTSPGELARAFLAEFERAPGGRHAAVLALLYLAGSGIDLACKLTGDSK